MNGSKKRNGSAWPQRSHPSLLYSMHAITQQFGRNPPESALAGWFTARRRPHGSC